MRKTHVIPTGYSQRARQLRKFSSFHKNKTLFFHVKITKNMRFSHSWNQKSPFSTWFLSVSSPIRFPSVLTFVKVYRNTPDVRRSNWGQMTCEPNYTISYIQSLSKEKWLIRPEFHLPCMVMSIAIIVLYIMELRVVLRYRRHAPFTSTYFRVWTMQVSFLSNKII